MLIRPTGRIARVCAQRPWWTIGVWALILVAGFYFAGSLSKYVTPEVHNLVTTESDTGYELDKRYRPEVSDSAGYAETVIVTSGSLRFGEPAFDAALATVAQSLRRVDGVQTVTVPTAVSTAVPTTVGAQSGVSESGRSVLVRVQISRDEAAVRRVVNTVDRLRIEDIDLVVTGKKSAELAFTNLANESIAEGETIGILAALVILIVVFGALVAAGLPLITAIISIVIALGISAIFGRAFELSNGLLTMTPMFGLALGIDYALLSVQRFREELADGHNVIDAVTITGNTANRAVLLSGGTFIISIGGLLLIPTSLFPSMALGSILVTLTSVIAALTLLPVILRLLGHRVNAGHIPTSDPRKEPRGWQRIARMVIARPAISALIGVTALIAFAAPALSLRLVNPGPTSFPKDFVTHRASDILVKEFGWGQPTTFVAVTKASKAQTHIKALAEAIEADSAFADTTIDTRGDVAFIDTHNLYDPADKRAVQAIERLRSRTVPDALTGTDATGYVSGEQAATIDGSDLVIGRAPLVAAMVLGASFLLLMIMFRSIIVPIKAILLNLLGTAATFGVMVAAYQYGWGSFLGLPHSDGLSPYLPVMVFVMLFGLSMDYHVFLLSRIRESYDQTGDNAQAIVAGLSRTGSMITGAAIIMIAVFSGFAASDIAEISQYGFGLAAAVLIDATIIRALLVPSFMALLGKANWYLPKWLLWLPNPRVEATCTNPPVQAHVPLDISHSLQ